MLRQAVVLGGRAVIPAAMGLVLTSPGFARAAESGAADRFSSGTRAPAAAAAAPVTDSAFHAGDPVSRRAEGPGRDRHHSDLGGAPVAPAEQGGSAGAAGDAPGEPAAQHGESATSMLVPASDTGSLPEQQGETPPQLSIGDALRVSSPLPVLTIDPTGSGPLKAISGRLESRRTGLRVEIALRRGGTRNGCSWWANSRFTRATHAACDSPRWHRAVLRRSAGGWRWRVRLGAAVPRGRHALLVRVRDRGGLPVDVERR
jgi:hypothetical protein